jgi:protein involved in polysaccharide export with SLBB domain
MGKKLLIPAVALMAAFIFAACAPATQNVSGAASVRGAAAADPEMAQQNARLEALYQARIRQKAGADFTIGPGDVLQVSVPEVEDLKDRAVRVSGDDTISLPLVGEINVKGMTEQDVRSALKQRLEKYMYNPQVEVFAKEYQSRQVAVVGMVQKPGLYTLSSPDDTVLSMISRAGGTTSESSQRILLVPAESGGDPNSALMVAAASQFGNGVPQAPAPVNPSAQTAAQPAQPEGSGPDRSGATSVPANYTPPAATVPQGFGHAQPIVIDLASSDGQRALSLPARPGDVIIVPAVGQVMVKGWVQNPGAFKITPGMTVLGAVAAAGGQMFSSSAVVLRTSANGGQIEIPIDLSSIEKGSAADFPVQSGDVVIVQRSVVGAVPYAVYTLMSKFGTGIYPAVPFF